MKTRSSFLTLSGQNLALTFLAGCLLTAIVSRAGEAPKPPTPEPSLDLSAGAHVKKLDLVIRDGEFTNASGQKQQATVENLADFARAKYRQNIVLSPGAGDVVVSDLKLEAADIDGFFKALNVASGMTIMVGKVQGDRETGIWAVTIRDQTPHRVEVFNLAGYLHPGGPTVKGTAEKLKELQEIILETLHQLKHGRFRPGEEPNFQFHDGANLFVVIGTDEAVDVARKVINALPGQMPVPPQEAFQQRLQENPRPQRQPTPNPLSPGSPPGPGVPKP